MPKKDIIHNAVTNALIKDKWIVTDDPYVINYEDATVFIDLGAERIIAAEREGEKIAVEIKSFIGPSVIHDMELALGQYIIYLSFIEQYEPDRKLCIAISNAAYNNIFARKSIQLLIERNKVALVVVDTIKEEISGWIN
jgi:hypothetical protein